MSLIRSAGLRGFRTAVAELGGSAETYARQAALPVAALDTDDLLVPDAAVATAMNLAARDLDCPDLGLRVARRQDLGMLGALALAIRNAATVADALECATRYLFLHAPSVSLTLEPDPHGVPGIAALRYDLPLYGPAAVQCVDLGLGFVHRAIEFLIGPYGLRTVELPHTAPAAPAVYEEFFGVPVRLGRPAALLRLPAALAGLPMPHGDDRLHDLALAYLAGQAPQPQSDLVTQVRAAVRQSLGTVHPDIDAVAGLLNLHPRTLQRRLSREGTGFAAVLDEERRHAAHRYLVGTDMPLSQVAALVGLSEQSALTRCCHRWWQAAPSTVRRDGLQPHPQGLYPAALRG